MGYLLNSLGNLPIDDEVRFYVFVINGQWQEPLYDVIEQNFAGIARSIGKSAVIAKGLNPVDWSGEVAEKYLGKDYRDYFDLLPALLVTDAHPAQVSEKSLRLLIPLAHVESRFGGWSQFFALLADFVHLKNDEFIRRFQKKEDALDAASRILSVKPGAFGISVNVNENRFEISKTA